MLMAAPSLAEKVAFLSQPEHYPEPASSVETVETHMSWVFLTDRFAYKLKKPAKTSFLDFSTLALRRHACEEELRLNRRLAPHVYIGAVALTLANRSFALGGRGEVVDWLVKMRRLPRERMLDRAIADRSYTPDDIARVAARLAAFYREATPVVQAGSAYLARVSAAAEADLAELRAIRGDIAAESLDRIGAAQRGFLRTHARLLERRAEEHRIVEAHGDLRPEHVALSAEPAIIDCLEFNAAFRRLDPVDELAFFSLECEVLGAPDVGETVFAAYRAATNDDAPPELADFYRCCRAVLRAKLALFHLAESPVRDPQRWRPQAHTYVAFAVAYAERLAPSDRH